MLKSSPIYGYALLDGNGLTDWNTFIATNTMPNDGQEWVQVFKVSCMCNPRNCDVQLFSRFPSEVIYSETFAFTQEGDTTIKFCYDPVPTKFKVYKNDVLLLETGYIGISSYQSVLDAYNDRNGFPLETIQSTISPTSYLVHLTQFDTMKVEAYSPLPQNSNYSFSVSCIDEAPKDCVVSAWTSWSDWYDNGNGTESRTRTRMIIEPPQGDGEPCPNLIETETRTKISQNCVVSEWSAWSSWIPQGDGTEKRTRTRTILIYPSNGGQNCPSLIEEEIRHVVQDCVVSEWSEWSAWSSIGGGYEERTRTRTILIPPTDGGADCPILLESETRPAKVLLMVTFGGNETTDGTFRITNGYIGDDETNIVTDNDFLFNSVSKRTFEGFVYQNQIDLSFHQELTTTPDGLLTNITIRKVVGDVPTIIVQDQAIDLSNYSKILGFSGESSITLYIDINNTN